MDGVEQAHSTRPALKNTGNFIGPNLGTVAEITLQRTDTTHDLSSESREAIKCKAAVMGVVEPGAMPNADSDLHAAVNRI